jgi:hypothetical protein
MGGDGQMDPSDLPALIEPVKSGQADYVKGNRFLLSDTLTAMPLIRRIGNRLLSLMTRWALGMSSLSDSQCGYTAITSDTLQRIELDALYTSYGFPNDMLFQLRLHDCSIVEIPVKTIYGLETSGINPFVNVPKILLLIAKRGFEFRKHACCQTRHQSHLKKYPMNLDK